MIIFLNDITHLCECFYLIVLYFTKVVKFCLFYLFTAFTTFISFRSAESLSVFVIFIILHVTFIGRIHGVLNK